MSNVGLYPSLKDIDKQEKITCIALWITAHICYVLKLFWFIHCIINKKWITIEVWITQIGGTLISLSAKD